MNDHPEHARGGHGHRHHRGHHHDARRGGGRGSRAFDYGELRLLVLALLSDAPSHGYELIKTIEDRFGGGYSPSPGVIYPTLAWLEDMGYARVEPEAGNRKLYRVTDEGAAFLSANRDAVDDLRQRKLHAAGRTNAPAPVRRAMSNLKTALSMRIREHDNDEAAAIAIAAIIDEAAQKIESLS